LSATSDTGTQDRSPNRARLLWLLIGIVACVVRIGFSSQIPPDREWGDAGIYDRVALNLLAGNGYSIDGVEPTRERPPAYPFFVATIYALTGRNLFAVIVVQSLLSILTVYLAASLASGVFDRRTSYVAAVLVATYPALIYYDTRFLREGPTALLVLLTVWASWRAREGHILDYLAVGASLAVISLCRPETGVLLFPAVLIVSNGLRPPAQLIRPTLYILIPVVVGWLPWTVRNYQAFGSWSPVRTGVASTIWYGNRWAESGGDDQTQASRNQLKQEYFEKAGSKDNIEVESKFSEHLADDLKNPLWLIRMTAKKAVLFWKDANGVKRTLPRIHPSLPILLNTYYYILLGLAVVAGWLGWKNRSVRLLLLTVATYAGIYALLHVRNRYRVPLLPVVFILSAGGLTNLIGLLLSRYLYNNQTLT